MKYLILLISLLTLISAYAFKNINTQNIQQTSPQSSQQTDITFTNNNEQYQMLNESYTPNHNNNNKYSNNANASEQKYAYNPRTGNVALITGQIKVIVKTGANVDLIASQYGLNIKANFTHLNTVFFGINSGQDIVQIANDLNQNDFVESAQVDVVEHYARPM